MQKGEKRPLQQGSNNDKQPHLQRTGTSFKNRTDELYLANLKEKYCGPDYCGIHWDEYMRIIQKAVYSSEGITEEECFMIVETWRRLEKKDIRHNSQKNMYKNSMINKNKLVRKIVLK